MPSPFPSGPWHMKQIALPWKIVFPLSRDAWVTGGSGGTVMGGSTISFCHRFEKDLTYWITAERSRSEISCQLGIAVPQTPCVTVRKRSATVGGQAWGGVGRTGK